jgi:glycosyltransferase involved in cell wall biosynthesis
MMTSVALLGGGGVKRDILVYADVNLNLIDGSAVWLASLTEMLSLEPLLNVHVLLKCPLTDDKLVKKLLSKENIRFIDPWSGDENPAAGRVLAHLKRMVLDTEAAANIIQIINQKIQPYRILVRGPDILYRICGEREISSKLIAYVTNPPSHSDFSGMQKMLAIHNSSVLTLLQTPMAVNSFIRICGARAIRMKIDILNPMVADDNFEYPLERRRTHLSLGYSGKFSPPYMIEEMLSSFKSIQNKHENATFHVVGDKMHNQPFVEGFKERVKAGLNENPGVKWHGGVSRERANQLMSEVMVASGWRDASFDGTVEISTKILEYAALGIPVLMRPAPVQVEVFGAELPTWVESDLEFRRMFERLITDKALHIEVATSMRESVRKYSMSATIERLRGHLL